MTLAAPFDDYPYPQLDLFRSFMTIAWAVQGTDNKNHTAAKGRLTLGLPIGPFDVSMHADWSLISYLQIGKDRARISVGHDSTAWECEISNHTYRREYILTCTHMYVLRSVE